MQAVKSLSWKFPTKIKNGQLHSEFTLGTAQLGLHYGIANCHGMPSELQANLMIQSACDFGVLSFDTARAYGCAESRLGSGLKHQHNSNIVIITKLDPLAWIDANTSKKEIIAGVDSSIINSCQSLKVTSLDTLLLHRWQHYSQYQGIIWQRLLALKRDGLIRNLGTSVYSPEQAIAALEEVEITHLQIPFNLLDWRWLQRDFQEALKKRLDVVVHVRSALLQGLLVSDKAHWPVIPDVDALKIIKRLESFVLAFNRKNKADLCYAYVRSFPWITSIVVGVETLKQLHENLELFQHPTLDDASLRAIQDAFRDLPHNILNPALW